MQQLVRAAGRVVGLVLLTEDAAGIGAAQRADAAVGLRRPVEHASLERLVLVARQRRRLARAWRLEQRVDSSIAVAVDPLLHPSSRTVELSRDATGIFPSQCHRHRAIAVALFGQPLAGGP